MGADRQAIKARGLLEVKYSAQGFAASKTMALSSPFSTAIQAVYRESVRICEKFYRYLFFLEIREYLHSVHSEGLLFCCVVFLMIETIWGADKECDFSQAELAKPIAKSQTFIQPTDKTRVGEFPFQL